MKLNFRRTEIMSPIFPEWNRIKRRKKEWQKVFFFFFLIETFFVVFQPLLDAQLLRVGQKKTKIWINPTFIEALLGTSFKLKWKLFSTFISREWTFEMLKIYKIRPKRISRIPIAVQHSQKIIWYMVKSLCNNFREGNCFVYILHAEGNWEDLR